MGEEADNRGDKRNDGGGAKEGENHKDQDNGAVAAHDGLIFVSQVAGKEGGQDLFAVEGVDRNEVEDGQSDIHENGEVEKRGK